MKHLDDFLLKKRKNTNKEEKVQTSNTVVDNTEYRNELREIIKIKEELEEYKDYIKDTLSKIKISEKNISKKEIEINSLLNDIKELNDLFYQNKVELNNKKEEINSIKLEVYTIKDNVDKIFYTFGEQNLKPTEETMEEQKPRIVHKPNEEKAEDKVEEMENGKEIEGDKKKLGIGLDVGTGFLVGAGYTEKGISYRSIRDAFISINKNQFNPNLFNKNKLNYIEIEDKIFIVGNDAMDFAQIRNSSAQRPLSHGILNPKEKSSAPVLREMFRHVIQAFIKEEKEKLCFSVPGNQSSNPDFDVNFHSMSIQSLAKSFGVDAEPVNEAFAVAVSELGESDASSALSFSFGAGLINAALTFKGMSVFEFSIDKSGDFIDQQAAKGIGESESLVCKIKENKLDLTKNEYVVSAEERALMFSYRFVIKNVLDEVRKTISNKDDVRIIEDIPIVISGGTSLPKGFLDLFKQELQDANLPFGVSDVVHATDPLKSVAKGCLILANSKY